MNLSEVNWDLDAVGTWPLPIKVAAIAVVAVLTGALGFWLFTSPQLDELAALQNEELTLKKAFEDKQKKSANLPDYHAQLEQIEVSLTEMLKQMPTKAEVASLLVDISQTALAAGLEVKLFAPTGEINQDFYYELPINLQVVGKYDELGLFVSGLAALPRIVTVHDVNIAPVASGGKESSKDVLSMTATIKTYNEGGGQDNSSKAPKARIKG
jgi:type IV pilus assembly protein PilO